MCDSTVNNYVIYGIYQDQSLCYIGSTCFNINKRFKAHYLDKRRRMGKVMRKYGIEHFHIKKICSLGLVTRQYALKVEEVITKCRKRNGYELYNINYGSSPNDERRKILSEQNKGYHHTDEAKAKISATHKGKKRPLEWRKKMSEAAKGRKMSPEAIEKSRQAHLGTTHDGKPIRCIELDKVFEKIQEAAKYMQVSNSAISACVRGRNRTCVGYHWEYVTENIE